MATPYAIVELDSAESTQDEARVRAHSTRPILVVARHQPAGRGRLGREWIEPDLALFSSLAFEPAWPARDWSRITLVAGLAVRAAITELCGVTPGLRWPNDLVVESGKIGGLLVEASEGRVVVGCGINLFWRNPIPGAASLYAEGSAVGPPIELARAWADRFLDRMTASPGEWGADEYRGACVTIGQSVSYASGSGIAVSVSDDGGLVIETPSGRVTVTSGEVRMHDAATLPVDRGGI